MLGAALVVASMVGFGTAGALPPGRRWAPVDTLSRLGSSAAGQIRVDTDSAGTPWLAVARWRDSSQTQSRDWSVRSWSGDGFSASLEIPAAGILLSPEPVVSTRHGRRILWVSQERDPKGWGRVLAARADGGSWTRADTVMETLVQSSETAGADDGRWLWVARSQQRFPASTAYGVRVRFRAVDGSTPWKELPDVGADEFTCSIAPLPSGGAMVVHAGESGLSWREARDGGWRRGGVLDPRPWAASHPRLALAPDRGLWLLWTERERVHVSRYRDGRWARGDSLRAMHADGGEYWSTWCDVSRDGGARPVLAWGDRGHERTNRDVLCVSVPDGTGWPPGEEVPGSEGAFIPTVARDRAGDVWLAWSSGNGAGAFVTHTYVAAVAESLRVERRGAEDVLTWQLSEPAPGSDWLVLRQSTTGGDEVIGTVRAGASAELGWRGPAPDATRPARYRVRRETLDARFGWTSESAPRR